jgi:hypothetical protein
MDMQQFAKDIVAAANETGYIRLHPISQKDRANGCILHFSFGTV